MSVCLYYENMLASTFLALIDCPYTVELRRQIDFGCEQILKKHCFIKYKQRKDGSNIEPYKNSQINLQRSEVNKNVKIFEKRCDRCRELLRTKFA